MSLKICEWDRSLLEGIDTGDEQYTQLVRNHVRQNSRAGTTVACIDAEGKVMGVGGIRLDMEDTWYAWSWISPTLRERCPIWLGKTIIKILRELIRKREVKRIVSYVDRSFQTGNSWLKRLGFKPFALYHFYDLRREDHIWYEWIKPDGI